MSTASEPRYVVLRGGSTLPVKAIELALDLEARGFRLSRAGDDLLISPASQLSADDRALVQRWKWHLLMLVDLADEVQ